MESVEKAQGEHAQEIRAAKWDKAVCHGVGSLLAVTFDLVRGYAVSASAQNSQMVKAATIERATMIIVMFACPKRLAQSPYLYNAQGWSRFKQIVQLSEHKAEYRNGLPCNNAIQ